MPYLTPLLTATHHGDVSAPCSTRCILLARLSDTERTVFLGQCGTGAVTSSAPVLLRPLSEDS